MSTVTLQGNVGAYSWQDGAIVVTCTPSAVEFVTSPVSATANPTTGAWSLVLTTNDTAGVQPSVWWWTLTVAQLDPADDNQETVIGQPFPFQILSTNGATQQFTAMTAYAASSLAGEVVRAEAAESTLSTAISTETSRAETAEAGMASTTALTAETTRAETAEANAAAIGGQARYASITNSISQVVSSTLTWTAFSGAPSITLPNDGNTYRVLLSMPYFGTVTGTAQILVAIGTSTSAILSYGGANVGASSVPLQMRVELQKIVGSGQTINVYTYVYTTCTVAIDAFSNAPCELAAYRVA
jgi:hypothetical protein